MRTVLALCTCATALLAACDSPATQHAKRQAVARAAVSAESTKASVAARAPNTGRWDDAHLVDRLVRSGLAPQSLPEYKPERYWAAPVVVRYQVGQATLFAFIYPDSLARQKATATLDTTTLAPKGNASPFGIPRMLIVQNNLAAVLVGGSDRQQERVSLAIGAGLPVATPDR